MRPQHDADSAVGSAVEFSEEGSAFGQGRFRIGSHTGHAAGQTGANAVSQFGSLGAQGLILLPNSRTQESEADVVGQQLMAQAGRAISRDELIARVWGSDWSGDPRTLEVHIRWLRLKIEDDPTAPRFVQTVRGYGYRFVGPDELE